jgi:phosphoglycolate phosphatase-like HAD superfamily hydrolase
MPSKIKVVVFDFDGVILESAHVKTEAFCDLYADHGPDVVAKVREHHLANLGISRFKKFAWISEHVFGKPLTTEASAELGERFSNLALDRVLRAPFVKGAHEALLALAPKLALFVASGTPQEELQLIVERRELAPLFQEVHGTPREKPAILSDLMARKQLAPSEVLFVGDGKSDHDAAVATSVAFLARDTPDLHDHWVARGVRRQPDLTSLPSVVSEWS